MITLCNDRLPAVDQVRALYAASPLRRPLEDPDRIGTMLQASNVLLSAWEGERLVGLLRGWTDGAYDGYVCDLAVHPAFQGQKVGARLLDLLPGAGKNIQWVLLASPLAKDYYAHLGWKECGNAWRLGRDAAMPDYETFQARFADLASQA